LKNQILAQTLQKKGSGEKEVDSLLKRIKLSIFVLLFLLFILLGCGGDSGNDGGSDTGTGGSTGGGSSGIINLAWDSSPEPTIVGYKIYYGKASKVYDHTVDAGAATPFQDNGRSFQLSGLTPGQVYYISVTSHNSDKESDFSNEVSGVAR
jgi:hypothetical protein